MDSLHLLIVADDPFARAALARLLADWPGCRVIGQMSSGEIEESGIEGQLHTYESTVLIWDLGWRLDDDLPDWSELPPIVVLLPDESQVAAVWASGVQALLLRDMDAEKLVAAARAAAYGLTVFDHDLAQALLPVATLAEATLVEELTPRELEVLQHLAEGLTNKAIARRLAISEHTVKFHVNALMSKLGAQSRTEAVVRATRLGLILL